MSRWGAPTSPRVAACLHSPLPQATPNGPAHRRVAYQAIELERGEMAQVGRRQQRVSVPSQGESYTHIASRPPPSPPPPRALLLPPPPRPFPCPPTGATTPAVRTRGSGNGVVPAAVDSTDCTVPSITAARPANGSGGSGGGRGGSGVGQCSRGGRRQRGGQWRLQCLSPPLSSPARSSLRAQQRRRRRGGGNVDDATRRRWPRRSRRQQRWHRGATDTVAHSSAGRRGDHGGSAADAGVLPVAGGGVVRSPRLCLGLLIAYHHVHQT